MKEKYLSKLEYFKILEILSGYAKTHLGKGLCQTLKPNNTLCEVSKMQKETTQALQLLLRKGNFPVSPIALDIEIVLKALESNITLSISSLINIVTIFRMARNLKDYFFSDDGIAINDFDKLYPYFNNLYTNIGIETKITDCIMDETTIADTASPKLRDIRKSQKKAEQSIKDKLNSFLHSSTYSSYIQEAVVTIRNDRYVIPIKDEYRNSVKGFVHDISASGSTVFIEPISIFELNNELNNLKIEEQREIEKILEALCAILYPYTKEIANNVQLISLLDFIFAKASFSRSLEGVEPILNTEREFQLMKARHPLIDSSKVVPIDVSLGKSYSSLLITGPNTGGKTVTLKTVGLLSLMACSGLHIPAAEHSSVYVFDSIFADIGDEQSIQESLSTFSAHMINIIEILHQVSPSSLVLLDELGSGTDPVEGSSLAISILEYFYKKRMSCYFNDTLSRVKKLCPNA